MEWNCGRVKEKISPSNFKEKISANGEKLALRGYEAYGMMEGDRCSHSLGLSFHHFSTITSLPPLHP
jgi:hypothetical protein